MAITATNAAAPAAAAAAAAAFDGLYLAHSWAGRSSDIASGVAAGYYYY